MTQNIETILDNHNYIVRTYWGSNNARNIVISFTGIRAPERHDGTFFGADLAKKLDIPWVGIIDHHENWYCDGAPDVAFAAARAWIDVRRQTMASSAEAKLVGFGISMGAYAVIKHSRTCGFDYVVSVAPQWSLDKDEAPYPSKFKPYYRPFMKGMGVRAKDVQGRIYVFHDPYSKEDCKEVEMLKQHAAIDEVAVCHAGHMVMTSIKGSRIFRDLLDHLDDPVAFRKIAVAARRRNPENFTRMIEHLYERDPGLAARAFRTERFNSMIKTVTVDTRKHLWQIAANLIRSGYVREAATFFAEATGSYPTCIALPRLVSWRGELLCYSHGGAFFSQTTYHLPERGSMVTMLNDALFAVTPVGLIPVPGKLAPAEGGRWGIVIDGSYLSIRDDGRVEVRPHLQAWEEFTLLPAQSELN